MVGRLKDEEATLDDLVGGDKWKKFEFLEHQLGVLDTKASAIISLDGILLLVTASFITTRVAVNLSTRIMFLISSILVLISALTCARVLWTTWATTIVKKFDKIEDGFKELIVFRDKKTCCLRLSVMFLLAALFGYVFSVALCL